MQNEKAMLASGPVLLPSDRKVVWRNLCMIGPQYIECIVEFSKYKNQFYILAYDLFADRFHVIDMFYNKAAKLIRACDGSLEKVMKLLDFTMGKMIIKHYDIMMSYEQFMPNKAEQFHKEHKEKQQQKEAN